MSAPSADERPAARPRGCERPPARVRRRDRLLARAVTGPVARGAAFVLDFAAALIRAARGRPEHPEERVVPDPQR